MRSIPTLALLVVALACKPKPEPPPSADSAPAPMPPAQSTSFTDREWILAQLGDRASPLGNGGKPVTLTLTSAEHRASGNAGCNRYTGPYTLSGNQLSFGPAISTKMACAEGMDVETAYLSMLPNVTSYQATDSSLVLMGASGELARFR
jgi:heat shock protein HslJ